MINDVCDRYGGAAAWDEYCEEEDAWLENVTCQDCGNFYWDQDGNFYCCGYYNIEVDPNDSAKDCPDFYIY